MKMYKAIEYMDLQDGEFDDDEIELFDEMTADDVEDWDSLSHITLIHEIEAAFGIRFTTKEVLNTKNVGEFIKLIENKIA